ncbi:MAG: type II secretion system F family protein [Candidatus Nanohaloarchaea archaeon]
MLDRYADFCYNQVGSYILDYVPYFEELRPRLSKAGINVTLPEYVSVIAFTSIAAAIFSLVVLTSVFTATSGLSGLILGIALTIVNTSLTAAGVYLYPSIMIKQRAEKIRDTLPFATMYMSTLAGTGTSIAEIFEIMSDVEEYGEVSKEAEKINRDIQTFGMDSSEALKKAATRTPSEDFKELLWGLNHAMTSGGSIREFLKQRAESLMNDYERRIENYAEQLSMLVEMYITVVIVGSIIFTSISVVMSSFTSMSGSQIVLIQVLSIFLGLPVISGMFILLVRGISPGGIQ